MKKGFTLIELLVVVLIIGILSAIALPQYTKAVEKSRMTQALAIADSLQKQYTIWMLANSIPEDGMQITEMGFDLIGQTGQGMAGSCVHVGDNCMHVGQYFTYGGRCGDFTTCQFNIGKFYKNPSGDGSPEYIISHTYTAATGWTKRYKQKTSPKVNLKPDFAALGYTVTDLN